MLLREQHDVTYCVDEKILLIHQFKFHFWNGIDIAEMKLKFPLFNIELDVAREETDAERRRRKYRSTRKQKAETESKVLEEETDEKESDKKTSKKVAPEQVLMAKVENVMHDKFKQTEEVKALTQEIIKTIRDIINMNPLYRCVCYISYFRRSIYRLYHLINTSC